MTTQPTIKNLLYPVSGIFIMAWAVLYLMYNLGGFFHLLLVMGIALFVIRIVQHKNTNY